MTDDIDIEEHDVLNNLHIRNMFPEITNIKSEIEDYEEIDTSIDIEEDYHLYHGSGRFVFEDEINMKSFNNKIIIGSKPCMSASQESGMVNQGSRFQDTELRGADLPGTSDQGTELQETSQKSVFKDTSEKDSTGQGKTSLLESRLQNELIIDRKTHSSTNSEHSSSGDGRYDLLEAFVELEDCKNFLESNPCYCEECEILFASDNDLEAHKMTVHSFLVAVSKNKAVKSTSKSYNNDSNCKSLLCNHCNIVFPNTIAFLKHTYELLPGKFASDDKSESPFENDGAHKVKHHTDDSHVTGATRTYNICEVCSSHFKLAVKLKAHMKTFHGTEVFVKHVRPSNLKCNFCNSQLISSKHYNMHISTFHSTFYHRNYADFEISKFQCPQCNLSFSSDYSVRIHLAAKHGLLGNVEDFKKIANRKASMQLKSPSTITKIPTRSQKLDTQNVTKTRPLPKSTLFKCNKCPVHFVSCISAVLHSRSCDPTSKKGNYKCHQCRRTFKLQDKFNHDHQHSISEKFKVIEITQNILNRIICKCKTCQVCFDEKNFMTFHTDSCYADTPSVQCKECHVRIHARAMPLHKKMHACGLTFRDFIIIEYIHFSMTVKEQEKSSVLDISKRKTIKVLKTYSKARINRSDKKSYFFCPTCKCYMRMNKRTDKHFIGQCKTYGDFATCKLCGLKFTRKGWLSHVNLHKLFPKLKLKDLKFTNIQNSRQMCPPFPIFKQCKKCKVSFFSVSALNNHICNSEEPKVCKYCKEIFSDLAYKLHVPFHEYTAKVNIDEDLNETENHMSGTNENITDLIKKYKTIKQVWNILYRCRTCDLVIDSYDKVVEHCQDHFCNMQSYNVNIEHCDTCDLNFVDECFTRHEKLHLNDGMDKSSFVILEYKYEDLPSESWMDMFSCLTREQQQKILSNSIYKFTRCVRMKVVTNGMLELSLYQCGKCKVIVPPNRVVEHAQNVNDSCKSAKNFGCSVCPLKFAYRSHKQVHQTLHKIRKVHAKSFRMIEFHADEQFNVTEVKNEVAESAEDGKKNDPEGLKFIRCQHCGKLINKHKYKRHLQHHYYYTRSKSKVKTITHTLKPVTNSKVLNFYVCKDCQLCVAKDNIKTHICDHNSIKKKCVKCSLLFRSQNLATHYKSHEKNKFNRSNMRVTFFDGDIIDKKPVKTAFYESQAFNTKVMTLYQCSQCTLCIWNKVNLSKHACSPASFRFTCPTCGFAFLASRRSMHTQMHKRINFNRTNIHIVKFKKKNSNKKPNSRNPISLKHKGPTSYERTLDEKPEIYKRKPLISYEEPVAKKRKIDNIKVISDFQDRVSNKYYKCKTCKLLFLTVTGLVEHENSCDTNRAAVKCNKCGLVFHASMINKHRKTIDCNNIARINILTIKQMGKTYNSPNNWILLCVNCDIHMNLRGLDYHLKTNHLTKHPIKNCKKCNIQFTSTLYNSHLNLHHGAADTDVSELSIAAFEETTIVKALCDLPKVEHVLYVDEATQKSIFSCDVCGLNFINENSLIKHKYKGKHDAERHDCKLCGLAFTQISLKTHMVKHHRNMEIHNCASTHESISNVLDEDQCSSTMDSHEEECDIDLSDDKSVEDVETLLTPDYNDKSFSENSSINVPSIYKCDVCNINFLHPNSLKRHTRTGLHNESQHECQKCGLVFSIISLRKHMIIHHNVRKKKNKSAYKVDINDSIVETISRMFSNNQPSISSVQDKNNENNSIDDIHNENKTVEVLANKSDLSTSNRSLTELESATKVDNIIDTSGPSRNIENNSDSFPNSGPRVINELNPVRNEVLNKNKLFKCSPCNVYFLTAEDCYEHTTNHVPLDTFEYISCKICYLQFCCEFLGRHMKNHREKTFSTNDLIVAEYHPNSGAVEIDTYLFEDRLKTKLVSTTTYFDTDNVDSTTANVTGSNDTARIEPDTVCEA